MLLGHLAPIVKLILTNAIVILVEMEQHVLMESIGTHVNVSLDLLDYTVKQISMNVPQILVPMAEFALTSKMDLNANVQKVIMVPVV